MGWIGVDLDGTLAKYNGWGSPPGEPLLPMVEKVRQWLKEGKEVRIFTARVSTVKHTEEQLDQNFKWIYEFCESVFGKRLPITCHKDPDMVDLWDDRCHPVEYNTGKDLMKGGKMEGKLAFHAKTDAGANLLVFADDIHEALAKVKGCGVMEIKCLGRVNDGFHTIN